MTTNYKETQVAGTSWQRAQRIIIENPDEFAVAAGSMPSLLFVEETITVLAEGKRIKEHVGNISITFNPENPDHLALDALLRKMYAEAGAERDAATTPPPGA